ncbi:hypothetical protein CPB83DRAFT_895530 [Crepidotus variabilis]|uniref:Transmembrane protein n=1 Tax=Crepidotus variabilis TaxID=179855 RepID=A0A9P6EDL5_9AGAR|nr:hypothetical protein CPB83DRAFT_895530 [Crepidotus variabilis]
MLPVLILISAVVPLAVRGQFAQSSAICSPDFAWMANSKGASPCQTASNIDALCNNGNWNIPQLNASVKYSNPKTADGTASLCTCSWASYNLISACIACQGFPEQIPFWGDYSSDCAGKISESYWPNAITIPSNVVLPFWSTPNPTTWTNQKFTPSDAKNIAQQGHPDVGATPAPTQKSKSTPVGPIVGGVVGGVVVIVAFIAIAIFIIRRNRKNSDQTSILTHSRPMHERKISDMTSEDSHMNMKSVGGWTSVNSRAPLLMQTSSIAATSPTLHTQTPSVSSLPVFSTPVRSNPTNQTQTPSPPPVSSSSRRPEDTVTPFTLPPTVDNPDQKRSHGEWPVFDEPNAPPPSGVRMNVTPMQLTPQRNRYNPPAYSESSPGDHSTPPRHRAGQPSTDSDHSSPSNSNADAQPQRPTHTPAYSSSSLSYVGVTPMTPRTEYASELTSPLSRGRSLAGPSNDHKGRPSMDDDEPSLA